MPDITPGSVEARNTAREVNQESVLRFRGDTYTAERRSYPNGLRRPPQIVFTSGESDTEIFYDGRGDFLAVLADGVDFFLTVDGTDDRNAVVLSKR